MKVLIDADGCPVVDETVGICRKNSVECIIVCDTSHEFNKDGARTVIVSKGADSADFALVNMLNCGDIAITQDYGVAAMCLAKSAVPVDQDGKIYNDDNISALLESRCLSKKLRKSGVRLKGKQKRTSAQNDDFVKTLTRLIEK